MTPHELSDEIRDLPLREACARLDESVRQGRSARAEDFLSSFANDPDAATELIYAEFSARSEAGLPATPEDFYQRFPQYRPHLERQFRIHELLSGACLDDTDRVAADSSRGDRPLTFQPSRGDTIGRYEILHELGRGAMGVVFAARHSELERIVALKVVPLGPRPDSQAVTRFRAEAKTLATLQHPNIVQVFDLDVAGAEGILAMELVGGGSLATRIAGRPQLPQWSGSLMATLARAVGHAHRVGVVHRDLKSANVLLTEDGAPKIVDFGLARCVTRDDGQTTTGAILGTPSYMAPEQAAGEREVTAAADIYALGAILYELLTGRPPFQGQTPLDTLQQVLREEPVQPSRLVAATPRDLETICLKCLDKEPARRYAMADELADDLDRFGRHEPITARPLSPPARLWRWCRRRPWQAGMTASLAALGLVIMAGSWLTSWWLAAERDKTEKNLSRALSAEHERRAALWESLVDRARAGRWSGRAGQRFDGLAALSQAVALGGERDLTDEQRLRLRNEAIACIAQTDLRPGGTLPIDGARGQYSGISFDRDVRRVAYPARDGGIVVRWLDGRAPEVKLAAGPSCKRAASTGFSPDDRYVAVRSSSADGGWIHCVYDLTTARLLFCTDAAEGFTAVSLNLDFDPQSKHVVAAHRDGSVRWYKLPGGEEVLRRVARSESSKGVGPPRGLCMSPLGERLAVWRGAQVEVVNIQSGKTEATFRTRNAEIHHVAWSRDGRFLAGGSADHCAYLWDVPNHTQHAILEGHQRHVVQVAFDPSGQRLATASLDGTTRLWDTWSGDECVAALGSGVKFSADGKRLGFGLLSTVAGWWDVADGAERRLFYGHTKYEAYQVAAHPRRTIAASLGSTAIRLWNIEQGRQIATLPGSWIHADFDPNTGDLIASGERGVSRISLPTEESTAADGRIIELKQDPILVMDMASCYTAFSAVGDLRVSSECDHSQTIVASAAGSRSIQPWTIPQSLQVPHLSPNGMWLANKPEPGGIDVWTISDRFKVAHLLDTARNLAVVFSPDNKWLATGSPDEYVFWKTGSWRRRHRVPRNNPAMVAARVAFSPDSRIAALADSGFDIKLVDVETSVEVATLPSQQGQPEPAFCFSSDGRFLLQLGPKLVLMAWDLEAIRGQLRELKLAW